MAEGIHAGFAKLIASAVSYEVWDSAMCALLHVAIEWGGVLALVVVKLPSVENVWAPSL